MGGKKIADLKGLWMRKKVLIVEDNDHVRQLVSLMLKARGHLVVEAVNCKDALGKLGDSKIGLVITGLCMHRRDGLEFIQELKKKSGYESLPIVVLTSRFHEYKKKAAELAGVSSWVAKPFIPRKLIPAVEGLWNKNTSRKETV